jgi:predicted lipoprotein with Yx(FWY)xxD motif
MTRTPRTKTLLPMTSLLIAAAVTLAACGGDDDATDATAAPVAATAAPATAAATADPATTAATATPATTAAPDTGAAGDVVGVGSTEVGEVLVDASGLSLYGFLNDTDGTSACYDACAQAWPPLLLDGPELPEGLDPAVFSVTERTDGTHQLVAGDWPLYTYFEDVAPGDVFGQGSGGAWYVVDPAGALIETMPGTTVGSDAESRGYGY